jgi:hypothetical protein
LNSQEAANPLMSIDPIQRLAKSDGLRIWVAIMLLGVLAACQSGEPGSFGGADRLPVTAGPLKPFKDDLFAYRAPLEIRDQGDYALIPYDPSKDINARDEIPVRKVSSRYVRELPENALHDITFESDGRQLKANAVGKLEGKQPFTVIALYGRGGDRNWGVDDERYGGNFNRLKNLVRDAGGLYVTPDFTDFGEKGLKDIISLIQRFEKTSRKLVLACSSMGCGIVWSLLSDPETAKLIDGAVFLGTFPYDGYAEVAGPKRSPIVLAHGSIDAVYPVEEMENFYDRLHSKGQRVKLRVFRNGKHGAPVRMIDWRDTLNWILTR